MGAPEVAVDVPAQRCSFNAAELRWDPQDGAAVAARLLVLPSGARKLALGADEVPLAEVRSVSLLGPSFVVLHVASWGHVGLKFESEASATSLYGELNKRKSDYERFEQFEQGSVQSYFQYYAKLTNQQNMLQDGVRTSIYRRAIVENPDDFRGLTAMDIGAGSGILSFFAAQAGASTVYAVEASSMAEVVEALAVGNAANLAGTQIKVVNKPVEKVTDAEVPDKVDVLVSEPIGTFLFNERMIESYLCARDRFLKPGGKMFPNVGDLCIAPFSDPTLHWEQQSKNVFWKNNSFYGVDLTGALPRCSKELQRQPVVDYINPDFLVAKHQSLKFDFATCTVESLQHIEIPFDFEITQPCLVHGIAGWFDAYFEGSNTTVLLSTAPWCPGTHWYQIRFMLETPVAVNAGQHLEGTLVMTANNVQSYYIKLDAKIQGTPVAAKADTIDLKDPEYRFYSSPNAYCPPGTASVFGTQQAAAAPQQQANFEFWQTAAWDAPVGAAAADAGAGVGAPVGSAFCGYQESAPQQVRETLAQQQAFVHQQVVAQQQQAPAAPAPATQKQTSNGYARCERSRSPAVRST
eukprot:TRINITY_DN5965_c0_g1_i1.p1 TRINITY_DN5965_c0_g1~~TRINITY_DN5965_c0_g1_i1.p1  ORF type:complete len:578 (+),score=155.42 TRINITY_DN5965_c0_g1_i1:103-1836(+)